MRLASDVPDEFVFVQEEDIVPPLRGTLCENDSLMVNMDVAVFCEREEERPWFGRIVKIFEEAGEFEIQWFEVSSILSTRAGCINLWSSTSV